ncbi:hypothetical protein D1224_09625 [Henriciella barbarensis]|uniref:JmjC domain-containing protein n=2 Tax=Henriciella barbarensis TaxID=86342 RepID=A0A399R434_9PROT|nr:hypothetical protein D1224_09625 [Henriciella barbarensis]
MPLFTDEGLEALLDRYPREDIGVYAMGDTPDTWRRGRLGNANPSDLISMVKEGRVWLNLRAANTKDNEVGDLAGSILSEMRAAMPSFRPIKPDLGLIISSPNARVFYHLDVARVMLFHVRGNKRIYVYPRTEEFVRAKDLEGVVTHETEEEIPYKPDFDAGAQIIDLQPGQMVSWAQNAPHKVENADDMNVSLSFEYMTPVAIARANAVYANAWLRKAFKYNANLEPKPTVLWPAKVALARVLKKLAPIDKDTPSVFPHCFTLNKSGPVFDSEKFAI